MTVKGVVTVKIGDVEVKKIRPGQNIDCSNECSGRATAYYNDTPYCAECLREEQQRRWKFDSQFFVNSIGERVHFDFVRELTAVKPS
jgi:hypothetical protein